MSLRVSVSGPDQNYRVACVGRKSREGGGMDERDARQRQQGEGKEETGRQEFVPPYPSAASIRGTRSHGHGSQRCPCATSHLANASGVAASDCARARPLREPRARGPGGPGSARWVLCLLARREMTRYSHWSAPTPTKRGVRVLSRLRSPPGRERRAGWRTKSGVVKKGNEEGQPTATSAARQPSPLDVLCASRQPQMTRSRNRSHHGRERRPTTLSEFVARRRHAASIAARNDCDTRMEKEHLRQGSSIGGGTFATRQPPQPARWSATNDMIPEQTHSEKANYKGPRSRYKRGNTRAPAVWCWCGRMHSRVNKKKALRSAKRTVPAIGRYCAEDKRRRQAVATRVCAIFFVVLAIDPTGCVASWSLELGWAERHFGDPVGSHFEYETGSHWNEGRA
ncbi:hypothetical protein B0H13DRAFT_1881612 [Mycena leptocephala]|nr:hypothetical protein B0H13DRAFT_1881612 [Mycena leptocephala]